MDVTIEAVVQRPRAEVARYVMDHRNDPIWIGGISESELLGDPPLRVGSEVRRVAHFLGKRIDYVLRVERLEEAAFLGMRSVKAPFPMTVDYAFEERPDGTLVRIRVGGEPGRMYRLAGPMLATQTRKSIEGDLDRLRDLLEQDATPS